MGYYGIDSGSAFDLLRRWSQNTNTKLRDVAELLTSTTPRAPVRQAPHVLVQGITAGKVRRASSA